jgi:hypothetical protein
MSAMTRDAGDFATHCLCTLSQDPTPYKAFVENKHQSAIRKDCRKAVEFLFSRFFESQLRLIKTLSSCPFLPNPNGINIHCRKPDSHRLRDQAEGRNPKMQRPDFSSRVKIKTKTKLWTTAALGCAFVSNFLCGTGTLACDFSGTAGACPEPVQWAPSPATPAPAMLMWHSRPRLWFCTNNNCYRPLQRKDESSVV